MREKRVVVQHWLYQHYCHDQVTSLRERGVTECILSGHAGVVGYR